MGLDPTSEVAPNFSSADAGLKASATTARSESPEEENAAATLKCTEQSENVIENKGSAGSKRAAGFAPLGLSLAS